MGNIVSKKKHEIDMLHGSLWDKVLIFALPIAATGILQQLFNAADVAVVGRFVGSHAMAAVGSNGPIIGLLVNLFIGIGAGTNVVVAQCIGGGDLKGVEKAVHTSILVAVIGGITLGIIGQLGVSRILLLLGVPKEIYPLSLLYLRIYLIGLPFIFLYNFESAILRSHGDTRTPMVVLTVSGIINVVLNVFFVVVLHRSVDGVAIATVTSNVLNSGTLFFLLTREKSEIKLTPRKLAVDLASLRRILGIGVPSGLQGMVFSLANLCVQSAINSLGAIIMAASAASFNLEIFAFYVLSCYGQACVTFVGQNYGAGNIERCRKVLKTCLFMDWASVIVFCSTILFFGHTLLGLFTKEPEVITSGLIRLRFLFIGYPFSVAAECMSGYFRGRGMSLIPALTTLIAVCGTRITWVYFVFPQNPTFARLMFIFPVSLGLSAVLLCIIYAWKRIRQGW